MRALVLIGGLISALAYSTPPFIQYPTQTMQENVFNQSGVQNRPVPNFSVLDIQGNIDVTIRTHKMRPKLTLYGDPAILACVSTYVTGDTLHISGYNKDPKRPKIHVVVETRYLDAFIYHGNGNVTGNPIQANLETLVLDTPGKTLLTGAIRLHHLTLMNQGYLEIKGLSSPDLTVKLTGTAKAKLTGTASLRRLEATGSNWFSLSWLDSAKLTLRADNQSYIQLAGITNWLDAELWGHAELNAKFLRVHRTFVKTHDNAIAEITSTAHQHTLATDASDIRFYYLPKAQTNFMAFDGAVLDMRDISSPDVQEPIR